MTSTLLSESATERTQVLLGPRLKAEAQKVAKLKGVSLGHLVRVSLALAVKPFVGLPDDDQETAWDAALAP